MHAKNHCLHSIVNKDLICTFIFIKCYFSPLESWRALFSHLTHWLFFSRYTPSTACRQLFVDTQKDQLESDHVYFCENGAGNSNFLDLDWLSSSGNSCEEEIYERYYL